MALDRETVGLVFQISADAKPAEAAIAALKDVVTSSMGGITGSIEGASRQSVAALGQINTSATGLASSFNLLSLGLAGVAVGLVTGLANMAKSASDLGSKIHDLSESTGVSTETLSALRLVAEQSSSSLDQVGGALKILDRNFAEAQAGGAKQIAIFKQLGVDLNGDVNSALKQIIARFGELPDGANKTALAMAVFGRSGASLIPTLNALEGDLDGNIEKARALGLVFSTETAAAADKFGDNVDELGKQLEGLKVTIGNAVIPAFTSYIVALNETGKAIRALFTDTSKIIPNLLKIATIGLAASTPGSAGLVSQIFAADSTKKEGADVTLPGAGAKSKRDEASQQALKRLRDQLAEEERLFKDSEKEIKRAYDQRGIDEEDFSKQQIAIAQKRLDDEIAILDKEKATIEASRFSKEQKQTQLEEVALRRTDIERRTADEIEKIDDDSRKRRQEHGIQFEQEQLRRAEAYFAAQRAAIEAAAARNDITQEAAERQLTEIVQRGIEERLALANAEAARAGENSALRAIANEKVKTLEIELASAIEQAKQRIADAQKRDLQNLRAYIDARNQLLIVQREQEVAELDRRASDLEKRAANSPAFRTQAIGARATAAQGAEDLQSLQNRARIESDRLAAETAALTEQQRLEARRQANAAIENEDRRHAEETKRIAFLARAEVLQAQGFDAGTAAAIAAQEQQQEKQLSLWDQLRVAAHQTADDLRATIGGIGPIFAQMGNAISDALANTVAAFVAGRATIRQAAAALYAAALQPLKDYLLKKARTQFALGVADIADLNFAGAAKHFLAGAALAAAAGLIDAGGAAIAGSAGGGAVAPSAGGGTTQNGQQGPRVIDQSTQKPQTQVIVIRTEVGEGTIVRKWIEDFKSNGPTRGVARRDLLGES